MNWSSIIRGISMFLFLTRSMTVKTVIESIFYSLFLGLTLLSSIVSLAHVQTLELQI